MKIIPWQCHVCGRKFDTPDGGLCSHCNKATCRRCLIPELNKEQVESKKASGHVCRNCATPEELTKAPFFKKIGFGLSKDDNGNDNFNKAGSILRKIAIAVVILIVLGFLMDLFSGFFVLRHSTSIYAGLGGLLILATFSLLGEIGSEWIGGKDEVSHPLHKRAFRLLALFLFAGLLMAAIWFALKFLGTVKL